MRSGFRLFLSLSIAFFLIWASCPPLEAREPVPAEETGEEAERDWLEFYYENPEPERFVDQMKGWAEDGTLENEHAIPALVAFLSRVLRDNRESIREWYEELSGLTPRQKQILHTGMLYSRVSEADEVLRETYGKRYDEQRVETPRILEMPLDKEGTLDMLWGFYYATGSESAVRRIVLCFRFIEAPEQLDGVEIPEGHVPFYKVLPDFAFDSLLDNARRHPRLVEILESFLEEGNDLLPMEREGVYDVLSELLPAKHPPREDAARRA